MTNIHGPSHQSAAARGTQILGDGTVGCHPATRHQSHHFVHLFVKRIVFHPETTKLEQNLSILNRIQNYEYEDYAQPIILQHFLVL
jgi:hypothetical protein